MKIIKTEILESSKYLDFKIIEYKNRKGEIKYWVWCSRPNNTKAVIIAAVVDKGWLTLSTGAGYKRDLRLVVIKEFRVPLGDYEWGFPAGLIDEGEDIIESAKRELQEETGLQVKQVLHTSPFIYNTAGMSDESIAMVYVECEGDISKAGHESSEEIETFLMDQSEVIKLLEDKNKKFGAKFWIIAQHFATYNSII